MKRVVLMMLHMVMLILAGTAAAAGESPVIRQSITDEDWYPLYYYTGTERKLEGLVAELSEELFIRELGWRLQIVPRPWTRAQNEVEEGETDFFVSIPTPAREEYALVTGIPLFRLQLNLYTYAGHPQLKSIERIRTVGDIKALDLVLVSNQGNGWHKVNMEGKGVKTQWVRGDEEIIRFLALKRADAMIDVAPTMNYRIGKMGLADKLVKTDVTFGPIDFYIMVGKKSPFASRLDEVNGALHRLQERGVFKRLWSKYH